MALANLIGALGGIFSFGLQISPLPEIIQGIKSREIKNLTLLYFSIGAISMIFWICFSIQINDKILIVVNSIGATLFTIYLNAIIYIKYRWEYYLLINSGLIFNFLVGFYILGINLNSCMAAVTQCFWQITTLETLKLALLNKDSGYINILLVSVSLANFVDWVIYGLLTKTMSITIVCFICSILTFMNIYTYFWAMEKIPDSDIIIRFLKKAMLFSEKNLDKMGKNEDNENKKCDEKLPDGYDTIPTDDK